MLFRSAHNFFVNYKEHSELPISNSVAHHIALIALARVEGVSPVNYLEPSEQAEVQRLTKKILRQEKAEVSELFQ